MYLGGEQQLYGFSIENEPSHRFPGLAGPIDVVKSFTYVFNVWITEDSADEFYLLSYACAAGNGLTFMVKDRTLHLSVSECGLHLSELYSKVLKADLD